MPTSRLKAVPSSRCKDLTGRVFSRLTVIRFVEVNARGESRWLCRCECGNKTTVSGCQLTQKKNATRSCGCLQKEVASKNSIGNTRSVKHGLRFTVEYKAWQSMISRCYRENDASYNRYGERGIRVCDKWRNSAAAFIKDMGSKPGPNYSLERKDSNKDYSPDNCKWATSKQQAQNRHGNRVINVFGENMVVTEAARKFGIKPITLIKRLNAGWTVNDALTRPVRSHS